MDKKRNRTPRSMNKDLQEIKQNVMLTMCLSKGLSFSVILMMYDCAYIYFLSMKEEVQRIIES